MESLPNLLIEGQEGCTAPLDFTAVIIVVIVSCVLGLLWSVYNVILVNRIDVSRGHDG